MRNQYKDGATNELRMVILDFCKQSTTLNASQVETFKKSRFLNG